MLHFKNALPAPFPLNRYSVISAGEPDAFIVWDNDLAQALGEPCCWDDAHTIAEHMDRVDVRSKKQIEAEEAGIDDEAVPPRPRASTRGHSYYRDGGL